jgi:hypothetical protein
MCRLGMRFARFQHIRDERGSLAKTVWLEEVHDEDDVSRRKNGFSMHREKQTALVRKSLQANSRRASARTLGY